MGGSSPSYSAPSAPTPIYIPAPQQDNSAMLAMLALMQQQNKEAQVEVEKSQDEALFNTQAQAAQQALQQGNQQAQQQLGLQEMSQQVKDAAALDQFQKSNVGRAESASGGTYDINAVKRQQMENLGAVNYALPQTAANLASMKTSQLNPAATTAGLANKTANTFGLPKVSDLQLGGI
jgi:hypothetical protein